MSAAPPSAPAADATEFLLEGQGRELGKALAFGRCAPAAFTFLQGKIIQTRIEPQTGYDANMVSDRSKEFKGREGAIGNNHDKAI
jgi:hypothetical protein